MGASAIGSGVAQAAAPAAPAAPACRVRLQPVRDLRTNTESMGSMMGSVIQGHDAPIWLTESLQELAQAGKVTLVADAAAEADIDLSVDLLKAYVMTQTMAKTANVVTRAHFTVGTSPAEDQVFRGLSTGVAWVNSQGEGKSALTAALTLMVIDLRTELVRRCAAGRPAS